MRHVLERFVTLVLFDEEPALAMAPQAPADLEAFDSRSSVTTGAARSNSAHTLHSSAQIERKMSRNRLSQALDESSS